MRNLFKRIITYTNILCAIFLIISHVSGLISPKDYWLFAFFGLSYPYFLIANLIFVAYWSYKFNKKLLISLIAILTGWNHLSAYYQFSFKETDKDVTENTYKVLTYNVRIFDLYDWTKKDHARDKIFTFIQNKEPDIICFQEFITKENSNFSEQDIANKIPENKYSHIWYTGKINSNVSYGIATYSTFPIINKKFIEFENTINKCLISDIKIYNDTIRVFNCHLQSIRFDSDNINFLDSLSVQDEEKRIKKIKAISSKLKYAFIKRAEQAEIISRHINKSPYPVIVCGDFNDTPVSYCYHKIKEDLIDAFEVSGRGSGNTYIGRSPSFRIDYILHSPELKSFNFEIPKIVLSDHYPVFCNFYIQD